MTDVIYSREMSHMNNNKHGLKHRNQQIHIVKG